MKTMTINPGATRAVFTRQTAVSKPLRFPDLSAHLTMAAVVLAAWATGIAITAWAIAQGGGALAGAVLFAAGFVFLAVAADRPGTTFLFPLVCGLGMIALALLGHFQAAEFYIPAAMIPGLGLGDAVRDRNAPRAAITPRGRTT